MKKAIKWIIIVGVALCVLIIASLLIIPMFVDLDDYKPKIEAKVSEATGRPFRIGGELDLSLFPWAGISFTDLSLGNPEGFKEKEFLSVKSFEVRIKLLPLIAKDIQVKRFILEKPSVTLIKAKGKKANWEGLGKTKGRKEEKKAEKDSGRLELPIKSLAVGEFIIKEGSITYLDKIKGEKKEVTNITLVLDDVSLDKAVKMDFSALLDGKSVSVKGKIGPVGKEFGKAPLPLDILLRAFDEIEVKLKGKILSPTSTPGVELDLQVASFSPRSLIKHLGQDFPVKTKDPEALSKVSLKCFLKGTAKEVTISDGELGLDESTLKFSAGAKDFKKPDLAFNLNLDKIDLDRYMPPPTEKPTEPEKTKKGNAASGKIDYGPARKLLLDGKIRIGEIKVSGAKLEDFNMHIKGKGGLFTVDPFSLKLYQGDLKAKAVSDLRKALPVNTLTYNAKGIKAGPLLQDLLKKDLIDGTAMAEGSLKMTGDTPDDIKKSLNGRGKMIFKDGAIKGIDLAGMVRNVKATFGMAEKGSEKPKTDFSELNSPFTITDGVVNTDDTSLKSPLIRVFAKGKANLVSEELDFRIEPKFVATLKGQGDEKSRSGLSVPVLVSGTFNKPKFRPDLKGMLKGVMEGGIPKQSDLKQVIPGGITDKNEKGSEGVGGIMKSLPFGQK